MEARRAIAFTVVFAALALAADARALPPVDPFHVYLEHSGHLRVGLLGVAVGAPDDGDPVPPVGVGGVSADSVEFVTNDCYRVLRVHLDYSPENASVTAPGLAYVAFPYSLRVALADAETGVALPGASWTFQRPGNAQYLLDGPRALRAEVTLFRGAEVDYALRFSAWVDARAECALQGRLIINEVEANPMGGDAGNEWVELLNTGFEDVDLRGWNLTAHHGTPAWHVFPEGTMIPAGERLQVVLPSQFIDNEDEVLTLTGPRGWEVDRTPALTDRANDARTWQRSPEGAEAWTFAEGTPAGPN